MPQLSRAWLDVARSAFFEELYRGRRVLCIGVGDGRGIEVLLQRGAAEVVGVDGDGEAVQAARQRLGERVEIRLGASAAVPGRFDVVMVAQGEALVTRQGAVSAVLDRLAPDGWVVAAARLKDAASGPPGATRDPAVGYYDLLDRLAPHFPAVTMIGQAGLAGSTLAPYGDEEAEPVLDAGLAGPAQAELLVAVAGPRRVQLGYGLIVLPAEAATAGEGASRAAQQGVQALRSAITARDEKVTRLETEGRALEAELGRLKALLDEREAQIGRRELDRGALEAALAERDQMVSKREGEHRAVESSLRVALAERERDLARKDAEHKGLAAKLAAAQAEREREGTRLDGERRQIEARVAAERERERAQLVAQLREMEAGLAGRDRRIADLQRAEEQHRIAAAQTEARARAAAEQLAGERARLAKVAADQERRARALEAELAKARQELDEARASGAGDLRSESDLLALLQAREGGLDEARDAAARHAAQMRDAEAMLEERDAYIAELEQHVRQGGDSGERVGAAVRRAEELEARDRESRLRIAQLEGELLRASRGGGHAAAAGPSERERALEAELADVSQRIARFQSRAEDAQREAWAHMKARSDAEAQAAEVREDTVRKLKDARKIANVELMRAMEEATKKAVSLKEELSRSEAEHRESLAGLRAARDEIEGLRAAVIEREDALQRVLVSSGSPPLPEEHAAESPAPKLAGADDDWSST